MRRIGWKTGCSVSVLSAPSAVHFPEVSLQCWITWPPTSTLGFRRKSPARRFNEEGRHFVRRIRRDQGGDRKCAAFVSDGKAYAGGDIVIRRPDGSDSLFLGLPVHRLGKRQNAAKAMQLSVSADSRCPIGCASCHPSRKKLHHRIAERHGLKTGGFEATAGENPRPQ